MNVFIPSNVNYHGHLGTSIYWPNYNIPIPGQNVSDVSNVSTLISGSMEHRNLWHSKVAEVGLTQSMLDFSQKIASGGYNVYLKRCKGILCYKCYCIGTSLLCHWSSSSHPYIALKMHWYKMICITKSSQLSFNIKWPNLASIPVLLIPPTRLCICITWTFI